MGRSVSRLLMFIVVLSLLAALPGCSGSSPTKTTTFPVPAIISLTPASNVSVEIGQTLAFTAIPENNTGGTISEPVTFLSSNNSILTIAGNGSACAGTWDSLTSPTVCTPGPAGVVQVRATALGVSSPSTTVYVHQHVDNIVVSRITDSTTPNTPCLSVDQSANYEATAYNRGVDITPSVGIFTWASTVPNVVTLTTSTPAKPLEGLDPGQVQALAKVPGTSSIYAAISGASSLPMTFNVCPVQSITLEVNGANPTSLAVNKGNTVTIKPTILDSLGNTITGSFLTWNSSDAGAVTVSTAGSVSTPQAGGGSITATCTPPTCNIGIAPTLPIYPASDLYVKVNPSGTATNPTTGVWVSTTGCGDADGCISNLVSISVPNFTVGTPLALPSTPNSMVFTRSGTRAFLGTDSSDFGTKGLMVFVPGSSGSVTQFAGVAGKVLAVSNDGTRVVVSDTVDTPNQVFIFSCGGTGSCSTPANTPLNITGATAAAFSPDGLKAFIVANSGSSSTLYIYSTLDALKTVPLSSTAPANDVIFLGEGGFGYIAGGVPSGVSVVPTCEDPSNPAVSTFTTPGTPLMLRLLPDGKLLALDPPLLDVISSTLTGTGCSYSRPYPGASGGPLIPGSLAVSNTVSSVNLGLGAIVPSQFLVSGDAKNAYLISNSLPSVLLFNIPNQLISGIQLAGDATPLNASLTVDGTQLYVGASDGTVHVLDTVLGSDLHQVSFTSNLCGQVPTPCLPDLVAAVP